jgi:sn-glycerol 3-phosphate transport system permease protein
MSLAKSNQVHIYGWLLLMPAAIFLIAFTHYPTVATLAHSFFSEGSAVRPSVFVGLENYQLMLEDEVFWKVVRNNFWFALGTIPASVALALLMAVWVNGRLPARGLVRMAYFTPTVLPMIAVANIWLFFYTPDIGLVDQVLGIFGAPGHNWLGDPDTVLGCLIVMTIWKESGFFMIFYLAALQSLPPELEEAAKLEGAGRWYFFRRVTFPLLMPTTLFVLINAVINQGRPGQRQQPTALLPLRGRFQLLRRGLRRDAHGGAFGGASGDRDRPVRHPREADPLPMRGAREWRAKR